jgi:hypothetical protein
MGKAKKSLADWASHNLICGWKSSWKFISMQGMALALAVQGVWITFPDDWRASIPSEYIAFLTAGCLVLGVFGRLYKQKGVPDDTEQN